MVEFERYAMVFGDAAYVSSLTRHSYVDFIRIAINACYIIGMTGFISTYAANTIIVAIIL